MDAFVLKFQDIANARLNVVGGKAMNMAKCSKLEGIHVPAGFCVTTEAYKSSIGENQAFHELLDRLAAKNLGEREEIREISKKIRELIEGIEMENRIKEDIDECLLSLGFEQAYAVRSSATAEDLPDASFAGQQETYLNIIGRESILRYIRKCWASLFTERAVVYRMRNGFEHSQVYLSVIVQQMVFPQSSGILFTADPVTSNRKLLSIDAGFGLGEALVSGLVSADNYKVREGEIVEKTIYNQKMAIYALKEGGTQRKEMEPSRQGLSTLTDEQVLKLEKIARKIEAYFGCPQDIEWCIVDDTIHILQSRPITTLYPIPKTGDHENHVFLSVGHQQMMTDAMKPLGISLFLLTTNAPMFEAGGRLFVDCTQSLASSAQRETLLNTIGESDPLTKDALTKVVERENFIQSQSPPYSQQEKRPGSSNIDKPVNIEDDPTIVSDLIERHQRSIEALKQTIRTKTGADLFRFILEDIQQLKKNLFDPEGLRVINGAMNASAWLNEKMNEWLGEKSVADTLSLSVPNNVTSEMGLELMDVADVIRPYPEIIHYLQDVEDDNFLDELVTFKGGQEVRDAINVYLDKYGMRCPGEIDLTRTRWSEKPSILIPMILSNIRNFEPGAGARKFEQGRQLALKKEKELLDRLRQLPDGERKAEETKRMTRLLRCFIGYREYPKYGMVSRYFVYKQALWKEAEKLVSANIIQNKEDIFYLCFEELREAATTRHLDHQLIVQRRKEYQRNKKLTPPRVLTSEGEVIVGEYKRTNLPIQAVPVSSGAVEGRARVILNMEEAELEDGDILVTAYTDPSWTPLFVTVKGLVTEIGGLMTHGAVIAREYGLPAVVGVKNATKLVKDGQRIRVNGTEGYIEIL
ncbi:phosphoenolpyruvate synthase [Sediminibacillus halophilus]|uniref:Rifampicin phosphotransferase n=1 Tax=Sediminibacillus halophilus TaxID=482461 RepID=A0A1G9PE18_9BACI|nr:phosphoenolpyruvate synthase [Sediminibacillus halophilus]SDL97046.1 pyruvate, water dikinase [Sediminibacillus halophilus]